MRLGLLVPSKLMRLSGTEEHALVQTYSPQQWHDFARYKCKTVNIAKKLEKIKKLPNFWETITRVALYSFFLPPITGGDIRDEVCHKGNKAYYRATTISLLAQISR